MLWNRKCAIVTLVIALSITITACDQSPQAEEVLADAKVRLRQAEGDIFNAQSQTSDPHVGCSTVNWEIAITIWDLGQNFNLKIKNLETGVTEIDRLVRSDTFAHGKCNWTADVGSGLHDTSTIVDSLSNLTVYELTLTPEEGGAGVTYRYMNCNTLGVEDRTCRLGNPAVENPDIFLIYAEGDWWEVPAILASSFPNGNLPGVAWEGIHSYAGTSTWVMNKVLPGICDDFLGGCTTDAQMAMFHLERNPGPTMEFYWPHRNENLLIPFAFSCDPVLGCPAQEPPFAPTVLGGGYCQEVRGATSEDGGVSYALPGNAGFGRNTRERYSSFYPSGVWETKDGTDLWFDYFVTKVRCRYQPI